MQKNYLLIQNATLVALSNKGNIMKKNFLALMALLVSVFAFASNDVKVNEVKENSAKEVKVAYVILDEVEINRSDIVLPLTISIPAPSETVIGISGPVRPNHQNWDVQNGMLNIHYTREMEIFELRDGGSFYIEVATSPMRYYAIKLIVE